MSVIELDNVKKVYNIGNIKVKALDGVSVTVESGEFISIMGPSGSGKSTFLNMVGCLDKPTSGRILINGIDTSALSDKELTKLRRDSIGFVFQHYNLIPTLTAFENVELPMIFRGASKSEREKAKEILSLVGLEKEVDRKPNELSGGQQQRVAIARALANNPSILLCDEPTGNLDTKSGKAVMDIIKNLNEEEGITVVLVTHNPAISKYAERTIRMIDGKIAESDLNVP
ncbi:MAG TPA: ABC transporter ATP-binding protein [Archaeoglobaceae archaeon]|nr:ABC transporter ATP-binding protein [Archaeoglobaceae archaeon]